jgi:hypothetical protein
VLCHRHIADKFAAVAVVLVLQRQRLIEDEPARAGEAAHVARLLAGRHQFEFVGGEDLHLSEHTLGL